MLSVHRNNKLIHLPRCCLYTCITYWYTFHAEEEHFSLEMSLYHCIWLPWWNAQSLAPWGEGRGADEWSADMHMGGTKIDIMTTTKTLNNYNYLHCSLKKMTCFLKSHMWKYLRRKREMQINFIWSWSNFTGKKCSTRKCSIVLQSSFFFTYSFQHFNQNVEKLRTKLHPWPHLNGMW